ncbi:hypothetical protein ACFPMF_00845 [Larkinella bovis]|uniref:Uncharacterized protein n=1 Tax=Larkinella bovis TaxID=683041 RepID=A0ABW0I5S5_9BACT
MTFPLAFQRALHNRPARLAHFYNRFSKPGRKNPKPVGPDWLVVFTFVMIAIMLFFG